MQCLVILKGRTWNLFSATVVVRVAHIKVRRALMSVCTIESLHISSDLEGLKTSFTGLDREAKPTQAAFTGQSAQSADHLALCCLEGTCTKMMRVHC